MGATRLLAPTAGLVLAVGAAGCTSGRAPVADPEPRPVSVQGTAPRPEASPVPRLSVVPAVGTVAIGAGPFDDRFRLRATRLRGTTLTGLLSVTSDVSELIDLEARADCYDRAGRLRGSVRQVVREGDGASGDASAEKGGTPLRMSCPSGTASAVLSVPVLVNE